MDENELRARILGDHALLRGKAEVLEALALRILRGDEDLGSALRLKGEEIQDHLVRHMGWEERELLPPLRKSGGAKVADQISAEHSEQRERISDTLVTLQDSERRPVEVARHMVEFVRQLERDMYQEEQRVLGRDLTPTGAPSPAHRHAGREGRDEAT
jgi:hemerythrin-like domain-containing protein